MTRRTTLAFLEWLVNCPLLPRPPRRAPIQYEPLSDCQFFGSAYAKVGQDTRLDPAPAYRLPVRVFGVGDRI